MSPNSAHIVHQIHQDFKDLIEYVAGKESQTCTAYEVELTLFRRLLALGAQLLYLFFVQRAADCPPGPVRAPDGTRLTGQGKRRTSYFSIFGKLQFRRHYFHASGQKGICPLDAELSLPPHCYSDLLRDWAEYSATTESYGESNRILKHILGLSLSKQALETAVEEDAVAVEAFYEQKAVPSPETENSILVIQADGKGVPMVHDERANQSARRGKGQKKTKKKESVVTAIYTVEPYVRTPEQMADALLRDQKQRKESEREPIQSQCPAPVGKEVRATMYGKDFAIERLAKRVASRESEHIRHRVALTDGAEPLQDRIFAAFPNFELILDSIHAIEYLWNAANTLLGETHSDRTAWVKEQLLCILSGRTERVIQTLEGLVQDPSTFPAQREVLNTTLGYYRPGTPWVLPHMHYDRYLVQGWPISTGVVEGACGHLVKDRMERSGMRWTKSGAQAILELQAIRVNDDWDAYHSFRRQCQHQRLYGSHSRVPAAAETIVRKKAA